MVHKSTTAKSKGTKLKNTIKSLKDIRDYLANINPSDDDVSISKKEEKKQPNKLKSIILLQYSGEN